MFILGSSNQLMQFLRRHRTFSVVTLHAILFALAQLAAFGLAYNFRRFDEWFISLYVPMLLLGLPVKLFIFLLTGQYRGSWRYVGLRDLFGVISSSLIYSFVFLTIYFMVENIWKGMTGSVLIDTGENLRQSVFALDWAATIGFVASARVFVRFYHEDIRQGRNGDLKPAFILGAGPSGEALLREIQRNPSASLQVVGILDDTFEQLGQYIHGVEVIGNSKDLKDLCLEHNVHEVLIALPQASPKFMRQLVAECEGLGVHFRTVPPVADVIEGRVHFSQIRDVEISDLLGREEVRLDIDRIGKQLRGQRVLITGAGGSIGSEMCRQVAKYQPARLILVEQAENNLFEIHRELGQTYPELDLVPCVADIGDKRRIELLFKQETPSVVFHAAAHKHVPMMEMNPGEAIKNNILGTKTIADAAVAACIKRVVMISTDKAVNPTSVMGCSKRVAEMYVQALSSRTNTDFITVRFGNVLGSSGSVVPIFRQQIAKGGPVTVTHPDMTRYFMTIPEAAQLVLQAGTMGNGGEIYVLSMGEPVKIVDLARAMISLSGLREGIDIEIVFSGKRPGEKLYEEVSGAGEDTRETTHPKIFIWTHRPEDFDQTCKGIAKLIELADTATPLEIQDRLRDMVPEYTPDAAFASLSRLSTSATPRTTEPSQTIAP